MTDLNSLKESTGITPRDYCTDNTHGLPGTGWRLPRVDELMSIVDYGTYDPAINAVAFPGTNSASYWSATTYANNSGIRVGRYFDDGTSVDELDMSDTDYVRCVRGLPNRERLFKNNGNGR